MVKLKIGYLGPEAAGFGYQAACSFVDIKKYPKSCLTPFKTHEEICQSVARGKIVFGLLAIENTVAGFVDESLDSIAKWHTFESIRVIHEVAVDVDIKSYCVSGFKIENLKKVYSHSVGLTQCKKYIDSLRSVNSDIIIEAALSTGDAAYKTSLDKESMALTGPSAAKRYKLSLLEGQDIIRSDYKSSTRFFVISKTSAEIDSKTDVSLFKTMLCFEMTQAEAGCLGRTLMFFANQNINMRVVHELRTPNRSWEYRFLVELECHMYEDRFLKAFEDFKKSGISMAPPVIYGSYTKAV